MKESTRNLTKGLGALVLIGSVYVTPLALQIATSDYHKGYWVRKTKDVTTIEKGSVFSAVELIDENNDEIIDKKITYVYAFRPPRYMSKIELPSEKDQRIADEVLGDYIAK